VLVPLPDPFLSCDMFMGLAESNAALPLEAQNNMKEQKSPLSVVVDRLVWGVRELSWFVAMCFVAVFVSLGNAQTTATNAVSLLEDNVVNARDTFVPLAIGALVLFVGIAAAVKFWKRIFGK